MMFTLARVTMSTVRMQKAFNVLLHDGLVSLINPHIIGACSTAVSPRLHGYAAEAAESVPAHKDDIGPNAQPDSAPCVY
jgi:hypothetical protein